MPTKKKRIVFIPRNAVLNLINKLTYESNLSYSKMINILVEEALQKRGIFNIKTGQVINISSTSKKKDSIVNVNKELNSDFINDLSQDENLNIKELKDEPIDDEIYAKFLMFLRFQERMKRRE